MDIGCILKFLTISFASSQPSCVHVFGNENSSRDSENRSCICHRDRVITSTGCNDSTRTVLCRQLQHHHQCTARLESSGYLKKLKLGRDLCVAVIFTQLRCECSNGR